MVLIPLFVIGLLVLGIVFYFVIIYNGLVMLSKNIDKAWANIDVLLKQRHDEIPKLIKVCEGSMRFEKETLTQITEARSAAMTAKTVEASSRAEGRLSGLLGGLFAVAENYPSLKTNENFKQLQTRISYLESQIADRREFYNDSVNRHNIRIAQIPDVFIARLLGYQSRQLFKASSEEKKDVDVKLNFPN